MVLLVRHAKAGSRSRWKGEDAQRPLDASGRDQAEGLRQALRWFGPTAVGSADLAAVRADRGAAGGGPRAAGRPEPALSEEAYGKDPAAALDRVQAPPRPAGSRCCAARAG